MVQLVIKRDINQSQNLTSTFLQNQGVEFIPSWMITPKITASIPMSYIEQLYLGENPLNGLQQKNHTESVGLSLMYKPIDNVSINTVFNYDNRNSNYFNRSYESRSAFINIQAAF